MPRGFTDKSDPRFRIWRHNSFIGHVAMAQANLRNMLASDSLTSEARFDAQMALGHLDKLAKTIRTRKDPA